MRMHFLTVAFTCLASSVLAHDTWVQTNTNLVRKGDAVHIDLMLGNHGNDHRDYKLASKVGLEGATLEVVAPDGKAYDIKDRLIDTGYTPKEGFHSARFAGTAPGLYLAAHKIDRVVNHGVPTRSIKSAKTFFLVSESLDKPPTTNPGFEKPVGHDLEIVPFTNPVTPMGPGQAIRVQVLLKDKPLAGARVSFIPRGTALSAGFDEQFERTADAEGRASFTPNEGNYYLVVVHHVEPDAKGADYERTQYSATLTVFVPEVCPCCGE
jgi:uncharacterized GH25 family protein